ncbi:MAG: ABC transporter permease [Bacillota bacterium]|nr:ABC transporter permease [Bacillota bacterium]
MSILQILKSSFKSIFARKLRSILTMLGVIIGIMAVIVLVGIGQGTTSSVMENMQSLGGNIVTINFRSNNPTYDELKTMLQNVQTASITPVSSSQGTAVYKTNSESMSLTGTTATYLDSQSLTLMAGRFISDVDNENRSNVVVLGGTIAKSLFDDSYKALGKLLRINNVYYTVIGLLSSENSDVMNNSGNAVILPIATLQKSSVDKSISRAYVMGMKDTDGSVLANRINTVLLKTLTSNDYSTFGQEQVLETMSSVSNSLSLMLGGIAAISLIVGGIGVMNIMLVSVTERTREIGVKKAVGATTGAILKQFLIEALVLCGLGGVIGVGLAAILGSVVNSMGITFTGNAGISLLAFGISLLIGIIFGLLPAIKASKLKPIDALKYE